MIMAIVGREWLNANCNGERGRRPRGEPSLPRRVNECLTQVVHGLVLAAYRLIVGGLTVNWEGLLAPVWLAGWPWWLVGQRVNVQLMAIYWQFNGQLIAI